MQPKPSKEDLIQLCLVERLTESQIGEIFDVHRNTVSRWKREYDINIKDWWKYQDLKCTKCGIVIDPEIKMDSDARIRLINRKGALICPQCEEVYKREYNRHKQAEWRENHREEYNEYMKQWRKDNKARWREIKRRSARNAKARNGACDAEDKN